MLVTADSQIVEDRHCNGSVSQRCDETLTNAGLNMQEARLGEIPQQSEGALPHLGHRVLQQTDPLVLSLTKNVQELFCQAGN